MIFPELPRQKFLAPVEITPPPSLPEPQVTTITADQWFERHFPQDAVPARQEYTVSPAQALRERIEFAVICIFMVVWAAYWHQFQ